MEATEAPSPTSSIAQSTIAYFEPTRSATTTPEPVEVVMQRKEFTPRVVAAAPGSAVRFPNRDPILHNVFSVSPPNEFDLGLYRAGVGKDVVLEHPGVVRVFCNVHPTMVAYILVVDTPFFDRVAPDGSFRLTGLPPGAGTLTVWHDRSEPWSRQVDESSGTVEVQLTVDRARVPRHTNKFGKPYSRERRRAY